MERVEVSRSHLQRCDLSGEDEEKESCRSWNWMRSFFASIRARCASLASSWLRLVKAKTAVLGRPVKDLGAGPARLAQTVPVVVSEGRIVASVFGEKTP